MGVASRTGSDYPFRIHEFTQIFSSIAQSLVYVVFCRSLFVLLCVHLWFTSSNYPFSILWLLYCVSIFDLRLLITPLVSCGYCIVCPSAIYQFLLHMVFTSRNWFAMQGPVAIILISETSYLSEKQATGPGLLQDSPYSIS